jgi:ribokinase
MAGQHESGDRGLAGVFVVGSINIDLVVRVERLPAPGETVTGGDFARHHGGKGANQAVAAARLGAAVTFVGAVGDDEHGRAALDDLRTEGVNTGGVAIVSDTPTGIALIVVDSHGENQIAVASGANGTLDGELVERRLEQLTPAAGVFLANLEIGDDALLAGARHAARHGWPLIINPAPARGLPAELLSLGPILLPNAREAEQLTGEDEPQAAAARLAAMSGQPVVVTLGANGALLWRDGESIRLPALAIEAVDTTGAGDTFAGAFAAETARRQSIERSLRFALVAAGLSVSRHGARGGMPRRDQVEALLD